MIPEIYRRRLILASISSLGLLPASQSVAQKSINCTDGEHRQINVSELTLKSQGTSIAATIAGLLPFGVRLQIDDKQLQVASELTQQLSVIVTGLAVSFNTCAITRQEYADGLKRLIPLSSNATRLEASRGRMAAGDDANLQKTKVVFENLLSDLQRLARLSSRENIAAFKKIDERLDRNDAKLAIVDQRLANLEVQKRQSPLPQPSEADSELQSAIATSAQDAKTFYGEGYALLNQKKYAEAIPALQRAAASVPLPVFYLALGRAYTETHDFSRAENALETGIDHPKLNPLDAIALHNDLGLLLLYRGGKSNLEKADEHMRTALSIANEIQGPDSPDVAICLTNLGSLLRREGHFIEALRYSLQALNIDRDISGTELSGTVAADKNNVAAILWSLNRFDDAFSFSEQSLTASTAVYGAESEEVARGNYMLAQILINKKEFSRALSYAEKGLKVAHGLRDPPGLTLASLYSTKGLILRYQGKVDGALEYDLKSYEHKRACA